MFDATTCIVEPSTNMSSTVSEVCAPKLVTPGILVIPAPNEVPDITVTPLILNSFPLAKLICSELVHAWLANAGKPSLYPSDNAAPDDAVNA